MRKYLKDEIENSTRMLNECQIEIKKLMINGKFDAAIELLVICEDVVFKIDEVVNQSNEMTQKLFDSLDIYCQILVDIAENVNNNKFDEATKMLKTLNKAQIQIENNIKYEIAVKKEIVFLPYNASMWDSLESVWKAATEDETCDVYVIPIPFYDRNSDGSLKEMFYEGHLFPEYVPITHFNDYSIPKYKPDTIFIHNPYDDNNIVTTVHPAFYSTELVKHTENLVYIPYFVLTEADKDDEEKVSKIEHFCVNQAIVSAHKTIVQSENYRDIYINTLVKRFGEDTRRIWEHKILGLGSPKLDIKVKQDIEIPEAWKKFIYRKDNSKKNIVLYNTSINGVLTYSGRYIQKMKDVFEMTKNNSEDFVLLWRPHPLLESTLKSMRPDLLNEYMLIKKQYLEEGYGIYDDSKDLNRAINICDSYYGDGSSVVELCKKLGKPVMLQHIEEVIKPR